jgi:hypothetical protein
MALTNDQEQEFITGLETLGPSLARLELERGKIPPAFVHTTFLWLASKDKEAEARREASSSAQIELARSAAAEASRASAAAERSAVAAERQAAAAERANTRATIALVIAIASIIITAVSIWITRMDAHK